MGNFFPRWTNWLPLKLATCVAFVVLGVAVALPYYATPKYTRVGYQPTQPVPFSHKIHAGDLNLDCRFCHSFGERSSHSNVPTNQVCFNCHGTGKGGIRVQSEKLAPVRKAAETGESIKWVKIHKTPDYVYFNHSAHLNRGVSCVSCHGKINEMEVVYHDQPQSMGWCLDCHRNPEQKLRPLTEVTNLNWKPEDTSRASFYKSLLGKEVEPGKTLTAKDIADVIPAKADKEPQTVEDLVALAQKAYGEKTTQEEIGLQLKKHGQIAPPDSCTACHR